MPNIYDVASAIRPIRPDKAFAEGRQAAVDARRGTAYAGAIERQNQISDENAPLREKTREAKSQSIDYEMIKEKAGATKDILSGMVDEQTFQANLEQLAEIAPEMGNRLKGLSHDEAKPIVDKLLGNFDPRIAEVEELARLERLAEGGDEVSAELLAARKQLMAAQSKADMREIDQELADIEKTKAETIANKQLGDYRAAGAEQRRAKAGEVDVGDVLGTPSEAEFASSKTIVQNDKRFKELPPEEQKELYERAAMRAKEIQVALNKIGNKVTFDVALDMAADELNEYVSKDDGSWTGKTKFDKKDPLGLN